MLSDAHLLNVETLVQCPPVELAEFVTKLSDDELKKYVDSLDATLQRCAWYFGFVYARYKLRIGVRTITAPKAANSFLAKVRKVLGYSQHHADINV